jgi:ankyrin repeat protein
MPIVATLYSDGYKELCELAINKKKIPPAAFKINLVLFLAAWDTQPVHDATTNGTLKNKVQASRQQEINEILVAAAQCSLYAVEKSKLLFAAGASPSAAGHLSRKPAFIWAAERLDIALVEMFIAQGVDVSLRWYYSGNALTCAARGSLQMVQMLVEAGANIDDGEDEKCRNALAAAVNYNQPRIVEYLVLNGANINHRANLHHCAPIHFVQCLHVGCKPDRVNGCHHCEPRIPEPGMFINCNVPMITLLATLGADLSLKCMARNEGTNIVWRPVQFCDDTNNKLCDLVHPHVVQRRLAFAMVLHERIGGQARVSFLHDLIRPIVDMPDSSCCLGIGSLTTALFANILART